jgi:hypothetical protein
MHTHDREEFDLHEPTAKRLFRVPKVPIGIHKRWAGDGHDKLYEIGFPIWAVVDDATSKWLDAWVVPSNRLNEIISYLFLCLVEKITLQIASSGKFTGMEDLGNLRTLSSNMLHRECAIKTTSVKALNLRRSM